jgi:hypothetical protein
MSGEDWIRLFTMGVFAISLFKLYSFLTKTIEEREIEKREKEILKEKRREFFKSIKRRLK